jgi:alpha-L-rhamnosidase
MLHVNIEVPVNSTNRGVLPGVDEEIGRGRKTYPVEWEPESAWPPKSS